MVFLFRIGLKLYSTDVALIQDAVRFKEGLFNFVELYIVPGSYVKTISAWKNLISRMSSMLPIHFMG